MAWTKSLASRAAATARHAEWLRDAARAPRAPALPAKLLREARSRTRLRTAAGVRPATPACSASSCASRPDSGAEQPTRWPATCAPARATGAWLSAARRGACRCLARCVQRRAAQMKRPITCRASTADPVLECPGVATPPPGCASNADRRRTRPLPLQQLPNASQVLVLPAHRARMPRAGHRLLAGRRPLWRTCARLSEVRHADGESAASGGRLAIVVRRLAASASIDAASAARPSAVLGTRSAAGALPVGPAAALDALGAAGASACAAAYINSGGSWCFTGPAGPAAAASAASVELAGWHAALRSTGLLPAPPPLAAVPSASAEAASSRQASSAPWQGPRGERALPLVENSAGSGWRGRSAAPVRAPVTGAGAVAAPSAAGSAAVSSSRSRSMTYCSAQTAASACWSPVRARLAVCCSALGLRFSIPSASACNGAHATGCATGLPSPATASGQPGLLVVYAGVFIAPQKLHTVGAHHRKSCQCLGLLPSDLCFAARGGSVHRLCAGHLGATAIWLVSLAVHPQSRCRAGLCGHQMATKQTPARRLVVRS